MTQNADTSTQAAPTLTTTALHVITDVIDHLLATVRCAPVGFQWSRHQGITFQADTAARRQTFADALSMDEGVTFGRAVTTPMRQHHGTWHGHSISVFGPEQD